MKNKLLLIFALIFYTSFNGQIAFQNHIVAQYNSSGGTVADGPVSVFSTDIDGDGDADVLIAAQNHRKTYWCENTNGLGNFGPPKVIADLGIETYGVRSVHAADLDNDGDMDVISAFDFRLVWNENINGLGSFGENQLITTQVYRGANGWLSSIKISSGDLDNDGDIDILSASSDDNIIAWYENLDGNGNFGSQQIINSYSNYPENGISVYATDIDGDGDLDVLSASMAPRRIAWYENIDGEGSYGDAIAIANDGSQSIYAIDIDGDNDMDVVCDLPYENKIVWYENTDGLGGFSVEKVITTDVDSASSVYAVDIDGDGDIDVLSACENTDTVAWYENTNGFGAFGSQQVLTTDASSAKSIYSADIDGDGDADVLSASAADDKTAWYENLGSLNKISGYVRLNIDDDICETTDISLPNLMVEANNGINSFGSFSQANGYFVVYSEEGDYTTSLTSNIPSYFNVFPNSHSSSFDGIGNTDSVNFCLTPNQTINDVYISLFPTSQARPGFNCSYRIVYSNNGTTQLSGSILLTFDDNKLNFFTSSEAIASQTINELTFDYVNLNPFESRIIDLNFNVYTSPTTSINDILNFTATINPVGGDFTNEDNIFAFNQTVIGSYDPNDIAVLEGSQILLENADEYLHYIIRFQNTGTAEAINIRVDNTLDSNLDWNTLQLESSSHSNRVEIKEGNEVSFIFNDIYLVDSIADEPNSHGFIAYKIKPKNDISIGDIMLNKADIFFDFNPAIITNTVSTEITNSLSINESVVSNFYIYPTLLKIF